MNNLSYAFFGATNYSKELLLFLIEKSFFPKVIFSIPQEFNISYSDKKVKNINYSNLKEIADIYNIPYYEIDSINGTKTKDYEPIIKELNLDLILVLGWYYMLPKSTRELSKYGAWGIHASLLPKYAGGAPLNWAIINGEKETGVTLFRMGDGIDDGDIIAQEAFSIDYKDTIKEVYDKATIISKQILTKVLNNIENVRFSPQDKSKIEVYSQRSPKDGIIDWHQSAKSIYDFIRAQTIPYPCAFSTINNEIVKIIDCNVVELNSQDYRNGEIVKIDEQTLVATRDKFLDLGVIDDGEKQYQFEDYARAKNLWGGVFESKRS
ncbi:methionyl-tRNA formyltransferase [Aliarcobacter butzleri]|uniref:methionyl-tRNA formyltransferase n=1 Tax=Aliarcobacter butzleri TaxID=28197 RepID=UPI002B24ADE1|nr:formyltransferase family protein [Aliarcobacter butzleri]